MIINVYALLAGSVALLQLLLGSILAILGWSAWRRWRAAASVEQRADVENRSYLLLLLACVLAGLNVVSWPLLYMVLQSYVPEWPGVMCIYGVTRIGLDSAGASGYLPRLLGLLQVFKPALVFLTGAWLVLYTAHRNSQTTSLLRPVLGALILIGCVSVLDAAAESAYLVLPKKNDVLSTGCCPVPNQFASAVTDHATNTTPRPPGWLVPLYLVSNLATVLGMHLYRGRGSRPQRFWTSLPLLLLAAANFRISMAFVAEIVCPVVLGGPGHHCLYDLLPRAPLVVSSLVLLAWGTLSVGWAAVASRLAERPKTSEFAGALLGGIVRRGQYAVLFSMALIVWALLGGHG